MSLITLEDLDFLASPAGAQALTALSQVDLSDSHTLTLLTTLRKQHTPEQARALLSMARLRLKAAEKFGAAAEQMFFTDEALQQASHPLVRAYRTQRAAARRVLDVCCGIGSDTLAFAQGGAEVLGIDLDPVRLAIGRLNAVALNVSSAQFAQADAETFNPSGTDDLIFFDPARRDEHGNRVFDVQQYIPPLSTLKRFRAPLVAAKLSPGVQLDQLQDYPGEIEFISAGGDLKEAVLWLDNHTYPSRATATLLLPDATYHWKREHLPQTLILPPRGWLVEPDSALIRAGLVADAAEAFSGTLLDETIAYFTTEDKPHSPWLRAWRILDWMPFQLKRLKHYIHTHQIGIITVKKRGSPITPEQLIAQLKPKGAEARTLVLTRCQGEPIVLICADYTV